MLISRFSALGDVAMTIPAVYDVCEANPEAKFVFITKPHQASLFLHRPANLTVVGIDLHEYGGIAGIWALAGELYEKYTPTHYADLHDVLRTKLLRIFMAWKGVRVRHIDKGRAEKRALTRKNNKRLLPLTPTPVRYRRVFEALRIPIGSSFKSLWRHGFPPLPTSTVSPKQPGERWIAIAPFAQHAGKCYPLDLMAKVIDHYAPRAEVRLFLFGGGQKETAALHNLAAGRDNVKVVPDMHLNLASELELMAWCDVMVSMDSANMHLASLAGVRVVSIWGATHPFAGFLGIGQKESDSVQLSMVCRPCSVYGNKPCRRGDYACLRTINPQLIIEKVDAC